MVAMMSTRPSYDEDADHEQYLRDAVRAERECDTSKSAILILCVDADYPRPSAQWRKRIADVRNNTPFAQFCFALVTTSALVRGALTAINWLSRPAPGFHAAAFATFDEAKRWAEEKRGAPVPALEQLHRECNSALASKQGARAAGRA